MFVYPDGQSETRLELVAVLCAHLGRVSRMEIGFSPPEPSSWVLLSVPASQADACSGATAARTDAENARARSLANVAKPIAVRPIITRSPIAVPSFEAAPAF